MVEVLDPQIRAMEAERGQITGDRLKILALDKQINQLHREYMAKQEGQFFEAMRLELNLEEKLRALTERDKPTARITREFVLVAKGEVE